jgi:hypothetical protein
LSYFNSPFEDSLLIALIPLLTFFAFERNVLAHHANQWLGLLITASKVQFLPFFLIGLRRRAWRRNVIVMLVGMLCIAALLFKNSKFSSANRYNGYFNGLAYSMASVSSWDARDFDARRALAPAMVRADTLRLPAQAAPYWGTSYWPTGDALPAAQQMELAPNLRRWYWSTIFDNPRYAHRVVTEPILTAFKADYRMNYIFGSSLPAAALAPHAQLMRHLGALSLIATLCSLALALYGRQLRFTIYNLFLLGYPILVVYGDGYYELEKHLFPTTLLGLVFPLAHLLRAVPSRRADTATARADIAAAGG